MNKLQFVIDTNVLVTSILIKKSSSDVALLQEIKGLTHKLNIFCL